VRHAKSGAVLGAGTAAVVEACARNVRVLGPLLHLAQVGAAVERVGGGRGPQGERSKVAQLNSGGLGVSPQHAMVNLSVGERRSVSASPAGFFKGRNNSPSTSSQCAAAWRNSCMRSRASAWLAPNALLNPCPCLHELFGIEFCALFGIVMQCRARDCVKQGTYTARLAGVAARVRNLRSWWQGSANRRCRRRLLVDDELGE
jgi:hypothetical protein